MKILNSQTAKDYFSKNPQENTVMLDQALIQTVTQIQAQIQTQKDTALLSLTQKLDNLKTPLTTLKVTPDEIENAHAHVSPALITALKNAKANIEAYHQKQIPKSWQEKKNGCLYGMQYTPLETAGLYVPGGRAIYPSTVLMNAIPAKIAGVKNTVMVTPPQQDGSIHPSLLVAAQLCGVDHIFKCGGAQSIFALAYGTESVPRVDKIVGPGNKYVTLAKQLVYGTVDIDKPAGPSEVLVYMNNPAYASFAAAELLAQLEHDPDAIAICISEDVTVLEKIQAEIQTQKQTCKRHAIIDQSLNNSVMIHTDSLQESLDWINRIASEHLVLLIDEFESLLPKITNAGAIFCGPYTPVTLGDYYAGTNHVLPTSAAARFSSPLGVMDFMKYSSVLSYTKEALVAAAGDIKVLTDTEGFDAHYNAVSVRLQNG